VQKANSTSAQSKPGAPTRFEIFSTQHHDPIMQRYDHQFHCTTSSQKLHARSHISVGLDGALMQFLNYLIAILLLACVVALLWIVFLPF
jgi:hypothetical protein